MQTYYLVQKIKDDSNMITQENQWYQPFQGKTWKGFSLVILQVNKSIMIEWKITIDLNPKSKAIFCETY